MQIQTLPIDQLRPAPYNPRIALAPGTPAFERLQRSLDEFSLVQPLVWNRRTGHIVGGHQRLEILRQRGATEVTVVVVDLPLEREKALNVSLNNPNVGSDFDPDKLIDLLNELADLPDFDETLTGFDPDQLCDLLLAPDPNWSTGEEEPTRDGPIRVTMEIDPDDWEAIRPQLDDLLADFELTAHVERD